MASCYSPWWKRHILYKIPGLFKRCPEGNYHWFWDQTCRCCECCDVYFFATDRHCAKKIVRLDPTYCPNGLTKDPGFHSTVGKRLPSKVEEVLNCHVKKHRCYPRTALEKLSSFTYHIEFENFGGYGPFWWVGRCDICHGVVRVRVERR